MTSSKNSSMTPLAALDVDLAKMAAHVEAQLSQAVSAFERRDPNQATIVRLGDQAIDAAHRTIEQSVYDILETNQLQGADLREAITVLKVAAELERVGDLAKNVAKRTLVIAQEPESTAVTGVARMGRESIKQIAHVLDAYGARDVEAGDAVWCGDDDLDELHNSVFQEILAAMMEDPSHVNACTHLSFIAKNFERVGDHATNIAEALHFLVTGAVKVDNRPKGDNTPTTVVPLSNRRAQ